MFKICYEPESQSQMGLSCLQVIIVFLMNLYVCFLLFIADCLLDFGVNIQTLKGKRRR